MGNCYQRRKLREQLERVEREEQVSLTKELNSTIFAAENVEGEIL